MFFCDSIIRSEFLQGLPDCKFKWRLGLREQTKSFSNFCPRIHNNTLKLWGYEVIDIFTVFFCKTLLKHNKFKKNLYFCVERIKPQLIVFSHRYHFHNYFLRLHCIQPSNLLDWSISYWKPSGLLFISSFSVKAEDTAAVMNQTPTCYSYYF